MYKPRLNLWTENWKYSSFFILDPEDVQIVPVLISSVDLLDVGTKLQTTASSEGFRFFQKRNPWSRVKAWVIKKKWHYPSDLL